MDLKNKAIGISKLYQTNNKVEAILLAGSVSRGWEDEHSDIELHVLWSEPPTDSERLEPIKKLKGTILDFYPYEDGEWSESFLTEENIKLEISNFLISTVKIWVKEIVAGQEIDYDKQCIAASIKYGKALYGHRLLTEWKNEVEVYPPGLSEKMILQNLDLGTRWNNRQALADRKDWILLQDVICSVEKKLLGILFGINKMYIHHPGFKWMHHSINQMKIKPVDLDERLTNILIGNNNERISELETVIQDIISLVKKYYPQIELDSICKRLHFVRPNRGGFEEENR